ncbi:MAG: PIN domain-containing protein [Gallionella sp.]|nr:PIN domain-containing protein [Gallionella sp.]
MRVKAFIDTNVVIYALGKSSEKTELAAALFANKPVISTQVLSETANVALKKLALPLLATKTLLATLGSLCQVEVITPETLNFALEIAERYRFSWYDSLIIAAALEANCAMLYTEDLQHGQVIEGRLTVINPFLS